MDNMPKLTVFISSPGDVNEERILAGRVIQRLNEEFFGILELVPIFWEHEPMLMSETFQTQLPLPSESDIFICVMWSRIGTRLPSNIRKPDGSRYDSGTEFEFENALTSFRNKNKPDLLIYKKNAEPPFLRNSKSPDFNLRLQQKEMLDSFFKRWFQDEEGSFVAAFNPFDDLAQFEERLELHLRKLVARQVPVGALQAKTNVRWSKGSPFRGLSIFDTEHAAVFFGRTRAIGEIISSLRRQAQDQQPFVMVLGMSGSGKSSLVRAGIIPLLTQAGVIEGVGAWRKVVFRPSNLSGDISTETAKLLMMGLSLEQDSCESCEQSVIEISTLLKNNQLQEVINFIQDRLNTIAQNQHLPENTTVKLLVIIDQMEEVFTTTYFEQRIRETFFNTLQKLASSGLIWAIGTFRSDFYHRCAEIPILVQMLKNNGQYLLTPPSTNEIAQIIRLPTFAAGLFFEKHHETNVGLDEVLIDEAIANSHNLALLQFTLEQLYQHRREDGALTYQAYEMLGGLNGALARRAEEVFNTCSPSAQATFSALMRTLVTFGEDLERAVAGKRWITGDASRDESELLEAFINARLIVTDSVENQAIARITHECLLSHWPRLTNWITQNQGLLRLRAHLTDLASFWRSRGCSNELLLSDGKMLNDSEELLHEWANALPPMLVEFIRQSLLVAEQQHEAAQLRQRQKLRHSRQLTTAFAILTIFAGYSYYDASKLQKKAEAQTLIAEQNKQDAIDARDSASKERDLARQQHYKAIALAATQHVENATPVTGAEYAFKTLSGVSEYDKKTNAEAVLELEQALYSGLSKIQQRAIFVGHQKELNRVGVSPDNQRVITASNDGTAKLWTINGELIATLAGHIKGVKRARFNHSGTQILTIDHDRLVKLWDGSTGKYLYEFDTYPNDMFDTFQTDITEARFDLNDQRIITAHADGKVKLFDLKGNLIRSFERHLRQANGMWLSHPDEEQLLTYSDDKTIRLWDVQTGRNIFTWKADDKVQAAAFSADGQYVAAGDDTGMVHLWSRITGEFIFTFKVGEKHHTKVAHLAFQPKVDEVSKGEILAASFDDHSVWMWSTKTKDVEYSFSQLGEVAKHAVFSPNGRYLMATSDSFIRVWDVERGQLIQKIGGHIGDVVYAAYANDGNWIISAGLDNTARLWSTTPIDKDFKVLAGHTNSIKKTVFSPNGNYLLSISDDYTAKLWRTEPQNMGEILDTFELKQECNDLLFSPDNQSFAIAVRNNVKRWDINQNPLPELIGHTNKINRIKFSTNSEQILTTSNDRTAKLWDAKTGKEIKTFPHETKVSWANFARQDAWIVTVSDDGQIKLWSIDSDETKLIGRQSRGIRHASLSFDGHLIVIGSDDRVTKLWSLKNDEDSKSLEHNGLLEHAVFSVDSKYLLTSSQDHDARLWDVKTGKLLQVLKGHTAEVKYAAFSHDNRFIATAAHDHSARLWRLKGDRYENIGVLKNHIGTVTGVTFHPKEPFLVTSSADQTIRFWPLFNDLENLMKRAETILPKKMNPQ
jgi:WD40 repeat protein